MTKRLGRYGPVWLPTEEQRPFRRAQHGLRDAAEGPLSQVRTPIRPEDNHIGAEIVSRVVQLDRNISCSPVPPKDRLRRTDAMLGESHPGIRKGRLICCPNPDGHEQHRPGQFKQGQDVYDRTPAFARIIPGDHRPPKDQRLGRSHGHKHRSSKFRQNPIQRRSAAWVIYVS